MIMILIIYEEKISKLCNWAIERKEMRKGVDVMNGVKTLTLASDSINNDICRFENLVQHEIENIEHEISKIKFTEPLKKDLKYRVIAIKNFKKWVDGPCKVPTLKKIALPYSNLVNLSVLICMPGMCVIEMSDKNKNYIRYHHVVDCPEFDRGLNIDGYDVIWEKNSGYTWDSTLRHSIWNYSNKKRIIIMADIEKNDSFIDKTISKIQYGSHFIKNLNLF